MIYLRLKCGSEKKKRKIVSSKVVSFVKFLKTNFFKNNLKGDILVISFVLSYIFMSRRFEGF